MLHFVSLFMFGFSNYSSNSKMINYTFSKFSDNSIDSKENNSMIILKYPKNIFEKMFPMKNNTSLITTFIDSMLSDFFSDYTQITLLVITFVLLLFVFIYGLIIMKHKRIICKPSHA